MSGSTLRVLFIAADAEGCGYARCVLPAQGLNTIEGFEARATTTLAWDDFLHHDVIVWARQHRSDLARYREFARGMGKILVYEIDDYLHGLPAWNPASRCYPKGGPELVGIERWIAACDGLSVSTAPLARAYRAFNPRVAVLPNSLDTALWRARADRGTGVRVGWVGSVTHKHDLRLLHRVLKGLMRAHPEARLVMMGYDGDLRREGFDIEFHPFVPVAQYPRALADLRLDIAIAPLAPHAFNRFKSHIKYLEYSALGIPCVASRMDPYLLIRHGETGFLASNEEEWTGCLNALVEDAALRRRVGEAALEFVTHEFDIRRTARLWAEFFTTLAHSGLAREAAVAPGPLLAQMHMLRAVEAARARSGEEALAHLRRAREADPGNAAIRLLLAETLAAAGEVSAAAKEARAALETSQADARIRERASRILAAGCEPEPVAEPSGTTAP